MLDATDFDAQYLRHDEPAKAAEGTSFASFQLDSSGILHFAIPKAAYRDANGNLMLRCYDPTLKSERDYSYESLRGVFDINTVPFIDSPISGSYDSYGSFGSYPITGSDGIYYG